MDLERLKNIDQVVSKGLENLTEVEVSNLFNRLYLMQEKELISELIAYGLDVNARNERYETLIHKVVEFADMEFLKFLIDKGANPFQINCVGWNALNFLFKGTSLITMEYVEYLFSLGLNPHNDLSNKIPYSRRTTEKKVITLNSLKKMSPFRNSEVNYKSAVYRGDLAGALAMLQRILNDIGPIINGIPLPSFIQSVLIDYRAVLYLTGNKEEAKVLGAYLNENFDTLKGHDKGKYHSLMSSSLFEGDKESFNRFKNIIRKSEYTEINVVGTYVLDYLRLMLENVTAGRKNMVIEKMKKYYLTFGSASSYDTLILKLFVFNEEEDRNSIDHYLETGHFHSDFHLKLANLYMIYLIKNKDYTTAKYISMKMFERNHGEFTFEFYLLHLFLLQYIEELEASTI